MDPAWQSTFKGRMDAFKMDNLPNQEGLALSIKIRVASGCFHREHSTEAYKIIDDCLRSHNSCAFSLQ